MASFTIEDVRLEIPDSLLNQKLIQKMETGQYEFSEARAARIGVKPGYRVLELGSGVGYISSICAQITDPTNIMTVEANPAMLEVIRHNLEINGATDTILKHGAVVGEGNEGDTIIFRVGSVFWGASIADIDSKSGQLIEVPLLNLGDLLASHQPDVVIMDIEGAEKFLFDHPWPKHVRQVLMEIHPRLYPITVIKQIVDCMSESGLTYDSRASRGTLLGFRRV